MEQTIQRVGFDPLHHPGEEIEPFALILDQGIFLPVATKTDPVSQVIHSKQMILPMVVNDLEHKCLLKKAHELRPKFLLFFGIGVPNVGTKVFQQCVTSDIAERVSIVLLTLGHIQAKLRVHDFG